MSKKSFLFEPFVTSKLSGPGLGLAFVAKAVADHGGVIEVESVPKRTTFSVSLPISTSQLEIDAKLKVPVDTMTTKTSR